MPECSYYAAAKANGVESMARKKLDPKAPRKHKSLTMHMNEYEYTRLVQAAEAAERGMLDFMRLALRKAIKAEIGD